LLHGFVAKHPTTKPKLERIQLSESRLNMEELINKAVENTEVLTITRIKGK